jgi:hypothetical protein
MLKGADMAVYEAVAAAGLVGVLTPISQNKAKWPAELIIETLDRTPRASRHSREHPIPSQTSPFRCDLTMDPDDCDVDSDDMAEAERTLDQMSDLSDIDSEDEVALHDWARRDELDDLRRAERARRMIVWLNPRAGGSLEPSLVYLAYGNESSIKVEYTSLALVVKVPSWEERGEWEREGEGEEGKGKGKGREGGKENFTGTTASRAGAGMDECDG